MQSRGWTVSVDRGNRWRDREMTPITLKIICMREGERGGQREKAQWEREFARQEIDLQRIMV